MIAKVVTIRITLTLIIAKAAIKILRIFSLGGTTLPGKIAMFLTDDIMMLLASNLDRIIAVTGTNGKTTTCRIIGKMLEEADFSYITNKSGANLFSGVLTTLIENCRINGTFKERTALFEVDEAAFPKVVQQIQPDFVVITNFFRDQLDRYGELYTTVRNVQDGIEKTSSPTLIVNADESLSSSIAKNTSKRTIYFGFSEKTAQNLKEASVADASYCVYCKSKYEYKFRTFGHLGNFSCPGCGFSRITPDVYLENIISLNTQYSDISIGFADSTTQDSYKENLIARINLPGLYNIYNSLAAAALGHAMEISQQKIAKALETFECGFGRMETIETDGKFVKLILVKNPTGFNQVLNFLLTEDKKTNIAFLINDNAADGTDISWLWDVDFEKLESFQDNVENFFTAGKRAEDMAVRLKYSGIYKNKINILSDYENLINTGLMKTQKGQNFYILPTYTAMLDIRKILRKKFNLKEFWK